MTSTCFLWAYASAPNSTTSTGQGDIPISSTGCTCFAYLHRCISWLTARWRVNMLQLDNLFLISFFRGSFTLGYLVLQQIWWRVKIRRWYKIHKRTHGIISIDYVRKINSLSLSLSLSIYLSSRWLELMQYIYIYIYTYIYVCVCVCVCEQKKRTGTKTTYHFYKSVFVYSFPNHHFITNVYPTLPASREGCNTKSLFVKRDTIRLNLKFFFSWTDCHNQDKEFNLPYYLPINGGEKKRWIHAFLKGH